MSEQPASFQNQPNPAAAATTGVTGGRFWRAAAIVAAIMVVLALIGVGLTTARRPLAREYWMWLVPIYGVLCVATAWLRSRQEATFTLGAVARQILHWLGVGAAVALNFYVGATGEESGVAAGLDALLLLAVGCFLAGVHLQWLFTLVGALLGLTLICIVKADQYLWLVFVVGGLATAGLVVAVRQLGRSTARPG